MAFPNCWEIRDCGRQSGGWAIGELGECVASKERMGQFCWAVAGTLCDGEVQGTAAQKIGDCLQCEVSVLRGYGTGEISNHAVDRAAKLFLDRAGEYARFAANWRAKGSHAVENADGRVIWERVAKAIDRLSDGNGRLD